MAKNIKVDIEDSNEYYVETVTNLGEVEDIVASEDVYSKSGILLLKEGTKINKKTYNALIKHKLKNPIDNSVSISDAVTNHELALNYYTQLDNFPLFSHLQLSIQNPDRLKNCLRQVDLNAAMRTKITVAKKVNPKLYEHLLRVSICSVMIGIFMGLNNKDCDILASAGLFHDLGYLHIDPILLSTDKILNAKELNFVYAHPIIMYNQLIAMESYPKETAVAILEHHERLGGNGYPKGIKKYSNTYSAILAITEVLISMTESQTLDRAIVALKTNASKFDTKVMNAIFKVLLTREQIFDGYISSKEDLKLIANTLKERMKHWRDIEEEIKNKTSISNVKMINTRMFEFQKTTSHWGINIEDKEIFSSHDDDPEIINDIIMLLEEALYIFRDIGREFYRNQTAQDIIETPEVLSEWINSTMDAVNSYHNKTIDINALV